jgi:hypothetical protein
MTPIGVSAVVQVYVVEPVAYPGIFFRRVGGLRQDFFFGGVQQIQLKTEGRENGDLEALAP